MAWGSRPSSRTTGLARFQVRPGVTHGRPARRLPHRADVDRGTSLDQRIARITGEELGALALEDFGNDACTIHVSPLDGGACPGRGAARSAAERCTADPGPFQTPRLERSRVNSAPLRAHALRAALCPGHAILTSPIPPAPAPPTAASRRDARAARCRRRCAAAPRCCPRWDRRNAPSAAHWEA